MAFSNTNLPLAVVISGVDRVSGPLTGIEGKLGRFGRNMSRIGRDLTIGLTLPIVGMGVSVISSGAKFEEAMLRTQALSRKTAEELAPLAEQAKALGATTVFTATQVAEAQGNQALAGFKLNEIYSATPPILNLAAAANMGIAESSEIAAGALNAYGFEADQANRISDLLVETFTSSATELGDLSEALTLSAPVAKGMRLEVEELLATIGLLGNNMFRGTMAGTAIRGALARLTIAARKGHPVLDRLRIPAQELVDAEGNVLSMANTLRVLSEHGATAGDILELLGQRAGPAFTALLREGHVALEEYTAQLRGADGLDTAAQVAAVRMEGAAGKVRGFQSALEGLSIAIGEAGLLDNFTALTRGTTEWVREATDADQASLRLWTTVGVGVAAVGPLVFIVGKTIGGFATLFAWAKTLGAGLVALFAATGPVGLGIAALTTLTAWAITLADRWDVVLSGAKRLAAFIGGGFVAAWEWLGQAISDVVSLIPDWMIDLVRPGLDALGITGGGDLAQGPPAETGPFRDLPVLERMMEQRSRVAVDLRLPPGATASVNAVEGELPEDFELGVAMGGLN